MKARRCVMAVHPKLSKRSKAQLLSVNLSGCYGSKKPVSQETVDMMNDLRDLYAKCPFQGYRRMTMDLKDGGRWVNAKRVYRLMGLMGLRAVYPKRNLNQRRHKDQVFPYLLKDHPPMVPHDAWCVDITYLRTSKGFLYLTALIDVVSRCVMGYHVSNSLETESCLRALEMAMQGGFRPGILNSDQGCQFTAQECLYALSLLGIKVSMDGKGRCLDNLSIERFWRTIKYEEVYLKTYDTVAEARESVKEYIHWYNHQRRHSALNHHRPFEIMMGAKHTKESPWKRDNHGDNADPLPAMLTPNNHNSLSLTKVA